jgi:hypothetical protein
VTDESTCNTPICCNAVGLGVHVSSRVG